MRAKHIVATSYVVAALDGPGPRFLCRDSRHGHWVVTTDHAKATAFATSGDARAAAIDYLRLGYELHHARPGAWRAYAATTKVSFVEVLGGARLSG